MCISNICHLKRKPEPCINNFIPLINLKLTMFVQAVVIVINFGLNLTHCVGPGWFPSSIVTFCPLSAAHT